MPRYGFTSPGAEAGEAIQQFLVNRAMQERQAQQDAIAQQERERQAQENAEQLKLQQAQEKRIAETQKVAAAEHATTQARVEAERERAAATAKNQEGVRQMIADRLTQGPLDQGAAQQLGIMGWREGVEMPGIIAQAAQPAKRTTMATTDAQGNPIHKGFTDDEIAAGVPDYQKPDAPDSGSWTSAGNGLILNTKTGETRKLPGGSEQPDASKEYGIQTADRTIAAIDGVLPKITNSTAGVVGNFLGRTGLSQDAVDVGAELQTVTGNIAFNALQQMRAASKTGGALGSVAQQELNLLQSVEGSLRQDQSPANLKAQLSKVRESMLRFKAAQSMGGALDMKRTPDANGTGGFRVLGRRPTGSR